MKKLLATLLAALMLLSCLPALAEAGATDPVFYESLGVSLDAAPIAEKCVFHFQVKQSAVLSHSPYAGMCSVIYSLIDWETFDAMKAENETADPARKQQLSEAINNASDYIAYLIVSDAPDEDAMVAAIHLRKDGLEINEVVQKDEWHYYLVTLPIDYLLSFIDDPANFDEPMTEAEIESMKSLVRTETALIRSELAKQLMAAEIVTPVDPDGRLIGQVLSFESTDLDGNVISSEDLFSQNKITMVNVWGTWCVNCLKEMGEIARIHERLREKGCGVVGVEYEEKPLAEVEAKARELLAENNVGFPNVIRPDKNPIFDLIKDYPTTYFVDSEGRILDYPIVGAAPDRYESTVERLFEGGDAQAPSEAEVPSGVSGAYTVRVVDAEGNGVEGALIQFCDDTICAFQPTGADGVATFEAAKQKAYEVHVLQAPEGFQPDETVYHTETMYGELTITLNRAE